MNYISTRGRAPVLGFEDVMLAGLARDGGLYLPETWPAFSHEKISSFTGRPFAEVAAEVVSPFIGGAIPAADLLAMTSDVYAGFDHASVTPIVELESGLWILELFHGPTLAFKDIAMQLLARMMDHVLTKHAKRATIVGATSGDTGGAAIEAFRHSDRTDVMILYPDGRISDVQRRMMTTPPESNVHAIAVAGTFDDCQALVKAMFNDHAFRDHVQLTAVNSINWARIMAQVTYYFVAAVALGAPQRAVSFTVPTGNFGDIFAGWVAKRMGLPIARLVIASNTNDILPRAVRSGAYEIRGVTPTSSPSMDIQISSNFERYLFEASGRNAELIRSQMESLARSGRFTIGEPLDRLRTEFAAESADEADVAAAIELVNRQHGYLMDPHSACGYVAATRRKHDEPEPMVILATAHPAKFPEAIQNITGTVPSLPSHLASLFADEERYTLLSNDIHVVEDYVAKHARCADGARA